MRELSFHKGLEKKELHDFLMTIKKESELPPEDSDIATVLWAKEFAHIRCFVLDEFLQSSAGEEEENKHDPDQIILPSQLTALTKDESPEIDSMLEECRSVSHLFEMVNLLFEILFLEERLDRFVAILDVLEQCFKEVVYKSNFAQACLILNRVQELKEAISGGFEEKIKYLEKIHKEARNESSLAKLKNLFLRGEIKDFGSFLQYLKLLGSMTLPLVADIWECSQEPVVSLMSSNFLFEMGNKDIDSLVSLVRPERLSLTQKIISLLGKIGERRVLPYLERYADHPHTSIKLEIIQALRKIDDESVNTIMLKFLNDGEGEVRSLAAMGLRYDGNQMIVDTVIEFVAKKGFKERSKTEKKNLLKFLAGDEAIALMLEKSGEEFDTNLIKVFVNMVGIYPVSTLVALDSGELGIVAETNSEVAFILRPKVKLITDSAGNKINGEVVDLTETDPETKQYKRTIIKSLDHEKYGIKPSDYFLAQTN